jgi:hypothetical protein
MLVQTNSSTIPFKYRKTSSVQVGMEFYRKCTNKGMHLYVEYRVGTSRFDAVLVKNNQVILIIEFKNSKKKVPNPNTRQFQKYTSHGVDVLYVMDMQSVDSAVSVALDYWNK